MNRGSALIRVVIVDSDPVFRSGLVDGLEQSGIAVEASVEAVAIAWRILTDPLRSNLVLLVGLELPIALQLKVQFPQVPMVWMNPQSGNWANAVQLGIEGYCPKGSSIAEFVAALEQVSAGDRAWRPEQMAQLSAAQPQSPNLWSVIRQHWNRSSLQQIDAALQEISVQLQLPRLSAIDQAFLAGRQRELRAARWFVQKVLPGSQPEATVRLPSVEPSTRNEFAIVPSASNEGSESRPVQAIVFDRIAGKLQTNLENLTAIPLEIDILKQEKKRELFLIVLRQLEAVLDELRFSQVSAEQLREKRLVILEDVWEATVTQFLGRYYTLSVQGRSIEVVPAILQDRSRVQQDLLSPIPGLEEVLGHVLFGTPLTIEQREFASGTPEATQRTLDIFENLTIQLANAVMQPLLNRFANVEEVKRALYDRRLLSTRDIERFRNDLSWRYRLEYYVNEPKAMFESRYRLWVFSPFGIERMAVYAPRREELDHLSGVQLAVTLALETRDAIAPRLSSAIAFLGSGIVYLLTEVIGRGIGLIGRGILKGIGKSVKG